VTRRPGAIERFCCQRRRLAAKGKRSGWRLLNRVATIVTPDAIMCWHRRLIALKWIYEKPTPGRRGIMKAIRELIVRMALENSTWGYTRIQGALKDVGHRVDRGTIARTLKDNGIKPAPDRPSSWKTFLRAHWGEVAVADFFTTEVWTPKGDHRSGYGACEKEGILSRDETAP